MRTVEQGLHTLSACSRESTKPLTIVVGGGQLIQQVHDEGITSIAQSIKSKLLLLDRSFCAPFGWEKKSGVYQVSVED